MERKIESNTTLTARSICDYDCIFKLKVIERKGNFCTILYQRTERRVKIHKDDSGEFLRPDRYSMSPVFRA